MNINFAVSNAQNLTELRNIICGNNDDQKSKCHLSIWCQERIVVRGYRGSIHLYGIIDKIMNLVKNHPNGRNEFDETERTDGRTLVFAIDRFENEAENCLKNSRLITKIFLSITWAITTPFVVSYYRDADNFWYRDYECTMFELYTQNQYANIKGHKPIETSLTTNPPRWII